MQTIRSHIAGAALAFAASLGAFGAGCKPAAAQAVAPTGTAPAAPDPASGSVDRIGDWELVCAAADPKPAAGACRLVQNLVVDSGKTALLVTVLTSGPAKGPVAIVSVPKWVYLAPGIEMKVDNGAGFKLLYETCNESGCHAGYKVAGEIGAAMRKGAVANHKVFDSQQKPISIDVSLKGFGKALDRLAEVSK